MQEIILVTHVLGSWITKHIYATKCRALGPRREWLHQYSALSGLLSTAESKQLHILVTKFFHHICLYALQWVGITLELGK